MRLRKGYGIPPTRIIKEQPSPSYSETVTVTNSIRTTTTTTATSISTTTTTTTSTSTTIIDGERYFHKKFKKVAAILSNDSVVFSDAALKSNDKCGATIASAQLPVAAIATTTVTFTTAVTSTTICANIASNSLVSSTTGSSANSEFIQRHITKLISENQAIVETSDPFWCKKLNHRCSKDTSPLSPLPTSCWSSIGTLDLSLKLNNSSSNSNSNSNNSNTSRNNSVTSGHSSHKKLISSAAAAAVENLSNTAAATTANDDKLLSESKLAHALLQPRSTAAGRLSLAITNDFAVGRCGGGGINNYTIEDNVSNSSVLPLISPESSRPNKSYGQLYIGGNAYTYLGLKCSTRSTFCTLHKSQPTYVPLSPVHNKVSMYSNWKVRSEMDPYLGGISPAKAMSCYDSRQRYSPYTVVPNKIRDAVTHSSYWLNRWKTPSQTEKNRKNGSLSDEENKENNAQPFKPVVSNKMDVDDTKHLKISVAGGIESTDDYTYVRGRGRGKYVCLECGIRCRKPSMLKKHIRTHTDVRPYTCKYCIFGFKTKGNLTKHMKSKAHYKKCLELGVLPVPTVADDSYVNEEILSKQAQQVEDDQEMEESDEDDDDEEDDDKEENDEEYIENTDFGQLEREAAKSLLSLSKMTPQMVSEQYNTGVVSYKVVQINAASEKMEEDSVVTTVAKSPINCLRTTSPINLKRKSHSIYDGGGGGGVENNTIKLIDTTNYTTDRLKLESPSDRDTAATNNSESTKENIVTISTASDTDKASVGVTSVIISVGSSNSGTTVGSSPKKLKAEFIPPNNGSLQKYASVLEDGRNKCVVCNKIFSKSSHLRLHLNIHYFEQPFRCESCAVSFRTKGHLHKHLGSNSHLNKVSMNTASGGQTSSNNPRPFKCDDCTVGFRIHGHLAKHLRSKMHIMKLECLGKLPFGTYAEMERCGINMNDIDTTDCENSLESLQKIAKGVVGSVMYVNNAEDEKMITDNGSAF